MYFKKFTYTFLKVICMCVCVYRERQREVHFKKLARAIVRAGKSEIRRAGWQTENSGRVSMLQS